MREQLNYSVNLLTTISEVGSGKTEYKAANFLVTLSKSDIKSVKLGEPLKDKYIISANQVAEIMCKMPSLTLLSCAKKGQKARVTEDWMMRCRGKVHYFKPQQVGLTKSKREGTCGEECEGVEIKYKGVVLIQSRCSLELTLGISRARELFKCPENCTQMF